MRTLGLPAHRKLKRRTTTDSSHAFARSPNWVEHVQVVRPQQLWVSDSTSIGLREELVAPFGADGWLDPLHSRLASGA